MGIEYEKSTCLDTPHPVNRKRGRKGLEDVADAIFEMATSSKMRAEAYQQFHQRFSISKCVNALDELQGVNENVCIAALELFGNLVVREMFLSLKVDKRLIWL